MRNRLLMLLALVAPWTAGAAAELEHRLAGIVEVEGGARQAWIVSSTGEERVYQVGDVLADGRITDISQRSVRVELDDRELVLQLAGDALDAGAPHADAVAPVVEPRPMSAQTLRRLLMEASSSSDRSPRQRGPESPAAPPPGSALGNAGMSSNRASVAVDGDNLRPQLNAALGLPHQARIVAVDERPAPSAAALAEMLAEALDRGEVPRLTVEGGEGVDEVYVMPEGMVPE